MKKREGPKITAEKISPRQSFTSARHGGLRCDPCNTPGWKSNKKGERRLTDPVLSLTGYTGQKSALHVCRSHAVAALGEERVEKELS